MRKPMGVLVRKLQVIDWSTRRRWAAGSTIEAQPERDAKNPRQHGE